MATYSTVVTLDNLNTVYKDLRDRIGKIGNVYHVKGSKYWSDILSIKANDGDDKSKHIVAGDVFNLILSGNTDTSETPYDYSGDDERLKYAGTNLICTEDVTVDISSSNWTTYFEVLEGMLEEATDDTAGVIKLGGNVTTTLTTTTGDETVGNVGVVRRGLKLTSGNIEDLADVTSDFDIDKQDAKESKSHTGHQAYIDIPVATASTYGVVTNQSQTIGGAKTFNSDLSVAGQLNLTGNFETTVNGINAQSIKVGDVTITASNGVITFA
jgi:hypothetical protein